MAVTRLTALFKALETLRDDREKIRTEGKSASVLEKNRVAIVKTLQAINAELVAAHPNTKRVAEAVAEV